ncbi:MAG: ABC transporter substrate-binding protein [Candidatus Spyradosoma sp.]
MTRFFTILLLALAAAFSAFAAEETPPRRIVSLSPNATAVLEALGVSSELVGVTRYCRVPAGASPAVVGGLIDPSAEAVLALRPDLLVRAAVRDKSFPERMARYGIPCVELFPESYENLKRDVALLGEKTGRRERADAILRRWDEAERAVADALARRPLPRAPRVLIAWGEVFAGRASYLDALVRICGGENAAPASARAWPTLSKETLVASDADLLIRVGHDGPKRLTPAPELARALARDPVYGRMPAVRRGNVFVLDENSRLLYPAPTLVEAIPQLADAIRSAAETGENAENAKISGREVKGR